jgi:hypothetical protein
MNGGAPCSAHARAHALCGQEQLKKASRARPGTDSSVSTGGVKGGENDREMTGGDGTEHMRGPVPAFVLNVQLFVLAQGGESVNRDLRRTVDVLVASPPPSCSPVSLPPSCARRQCAARGLKEESAVITRRENDLFQQEKRIWRIWAPTDTSSFSGPNRVQKAAPRNGCSTL